MKIAIVRTDKIGDMVLTLPMAGAIREAAPGCEILLVASRYVEPLVTGQPCLDEVCFIEDFAGGVLEILKSRRPDAVFYPRPRPGECFAGLRAGVKHRIGTAFRAYSFLFDCKVRDHRKTGNYHEAEYNVRMVAKFFGKDLETVLVPPVIKNEARKSSEGKARALGLDTDAPYIIFHPGSGGSARDLPVAKMAGAAKTVAERTGIRIALTGSGAERGICEKFREAVPAAVSLAGSMDLYETIAFISGARVLCANSTGVLHIAAALGVPVAGLFPNTSHISARRWGPFSKKSVVISPPVDAENPDDMSLIDPLKVAGAVIDLSAE